MLSCTLLGHLGRSWHSAVQAAIRPAAEAVDDTHLVSMLNLYLGEQHDGLAAEVGRGGGDTARI
jgi:hypothetical protein